MKKSKNLKKNIRLIHKWFGLILGIQVLFWVAGGVVMSIFPLEMVRGADRSVEPVVVTLNSNDFQIPLSNVLNKYPNAQQIQADYWMGQAVFRVFMDNSQLLVDAGTGTQISPISLEQAEAIALADYTETTTVKTINNILKAEGEVRGREGELWQVILDDDRNTRLYVSKSSGEVVARRNDVWRIFDFFWMLHIMDYEDRDDFNNLLLQSFAVSSLLFVISGLWLFLYSFRRREFSWIIGKKKTDPDQNTTNKNL